MLTTRRRSRQINGLARDRFIAPMTARPPIDVLLLILCLCLAIGCGRAIGRRAARIRAVAHRRVRLGPLWKRWAGRRVSRGQRRALAPGRRGIWQAVQADAGRANGRDPRWPGAGAFRRGDWRDHDHAGARGAGRFFLSRASLRRRRRLAQGGGAGFRARRLRRWSRSNSVR